MATPAAVSASRLDSERLKAFVISLLAEDDTTGKRPILSLSYADREGLAHLLTQRSKYKPTSRRDLVSKVLIRNLRDEIKGYQ